jgi:polysaccharide biosynthesis transport protein
MVAKSFSEEIRWYISILIRWAWLIVLTVVLAGVITLIISVNMKQLYQATALVLIEAPNNNSVDYTAVMTSERLTKTYAERMATRPILEGVISRLNLQIEIQKLAETIEVTPIQDTPLIQIQVESNDPGQAALIANSLIAEFCEKNLAQQASRYSASKQNYEAQLSQLDQQIQATTDQLNKFGGTQADEVERDKLETTLSQYRQTYASLLQSYEQVRLAEAQNTSNVVLEESATVPTEPVSPKVFTNSVLAAVLGLLLSLGFVFLYEAVDDSIHSPEDLERHLGLSVLGLIAHHEVTGNRPITDIQPRGPITEAFRSIRTNIDFTAIDCPLRTILVASPTPQEGKSTVAINLAVVFSQSQRKVILVDADLRRPSIHEQMGMQNQKGLGDIFLASRSPQFDLSMIESFLQTTEIPGLSILTAGKQVPNPAELIGSAKMTEILNHLIQIADIVIIDSSPVLAVTDAVVLAPRTDSTVVVVKPGSTKLGACRQTIEQLQHVGTKILGVVLNDVQLSRSPHTYYRYAGHYLYGEQYRETSSQMKNRKKKSFFDRFLSKSGA